MSLMENVEYLEKGNDSQRRICVYTALRDMGLEPIVQEYSGGTNLIYTFGRGREVGIASHFDVAYDRDDSSKMSPGANDNASAVAVALDILERYKQDPLENIGIRGLFFDGEEAGLRGSRHYVQLGGLEGLEGVYNMELVGQGNMVAFWGDEKLYDGKLLKAIESAALERGVKSFRFPDIRKFLHNSGDHQSFNEVGFNEAFCITAIGEKDLEFAMKHLTLSNGESGGGVSDDVTFQAPLFKNYHKVTDTSDHLSEESLQMVSDLLWESLCRLDEGA
jgi:Zn-dependent M28 family amino/carboxypeptidase